MVQPAPYQPQGADLLLGVILRVSEAAVVVLVALVVLVVVVVGQ